MSQNINVGDTLIQLGMAQEVWRRDSFGSKFCLVISASFQLLFHSYLIHFILTECVLVVMKTISIWRNNWINDT